MFHESAGPGLRALILVIISIALIVIDQRTPFFHAFSMRLSSQAAYPLQRMVDDPVRFIHWLNTSVVTQSHLLDENAKLRAEEILLQARLQRLLALQKENAQLRQLLQSTPQISGKVAIARLLAVALDPNLEQVVLDKGSRDNVYRGQPVLDGFGVMGQVIDVGPETSKILLLTDKQSAIPVEDYRNGVRAIAVGMGVSGRLALMNVPAESDIQPGDLFITSGLGMCFPIGYPVGTVVQIKAAKNELTKKIMLAPSAHLDQTEQVLLSWPSKTELQQAVEAQLANTAISAPATTTASASTAPVDKTDQADKTDKKQLAKTLKNNRAVDAIQSDTAKIVKAMKAVKTDKTESAAGDQEVKNT